MFAATLLERATTLVSHCRSRALVLATAESCTGGLLAALLTEVPGASAAFDRGFVTYSNEAKSELLSVPAHLIQEHGAVSAAVAEAMALGVLAHAKADVAVSVTGVAGPGGGTNDKPVGLVWFGCARRAGAVHTIDRRFGDLGRATIRLEAVDQALELFEAAAGLR